LAGRVGRGYWLSGGWLRLDTPYPVRREWGGELHAGLVSLHDTRGLLFRDVRLERVLGLPGTGRELSERRTLLLQLLPPGGTLQLLHLGRSPRCVQDGLRLLLHHLRS